MLVNDCQLKACYCTMSTHIWSCGWCDTPLVTMCRLSGLYEPYFSMLPVEIKGFAYMCGGRSSARRSYICSRQCTHDSILIMSRAIRAVFIERVDKSSYCEGACQWKLGRPSISIWTVVTRPNWSHKCHGFLLTLPSWIDRPIYKLCRISNRFSSESQHKEL